MQRTELGSRDILDSLQVFSEIAASLSGVSEVSEICDRVVERLNASLNLNTCSIMLVEARGDELVNVAGTSPRGANEPAPATHRRFRLGEGIAGTVAATGTPILVSDTARDERFSGVAVTPVRSLLCLPIGAADRTLGVLNLSHADPDFFRTDQQTVFGILGTMLGKLISEATLTRELAVFNQDLERQVAERTREIQASHAYQRKILANASDLVLTVDWRGRVTYVNPRIAELGHTADGLLGQPFSVLCDGDALPAPLIDAIDGRVVRNVELALSRSDGNPIDTLCSFSPMEGPDGTQGALVMVRDITRNRRLEEQVRQMEKLTAVGTLVAGIAHEINNKLVPILVYSELLQRGDLGEAELGHMRTVHKSAMGARRIMESLLRFSRQDAPRKEIRSLNEVVRDVVNMVQFRGKKQDVELSVELAEDLPLARMDAHQISQVALNLLNNAYDALEGVAGAAQIATHGDAEAVTLTVTDDGPGIPAHVRARVFDPFFTTKEVGKGTGLGLSLCYGILQEHGGSIEVDSRPGHTCFTVTLPIAGPEVVTGPKPRVPQVGEVSGHLLLVGDDATLLDVMEHVLGECHQVRRATTAEVRGRVAEGGLDALVMDPGNDNQVETLLDWLDREHPGLGRRVLVLSGNPDGVGAGLGERLPPGRVLHKPFRADEVRRMVAALLHEESAP